ncbi:hypothetical protein [Cupriavidus alkaliphilus]|uniref:hypothetical protein n=1 Tax=Cupriavidus alkaliphilus TaxID=942866 RepID=UPI000DC3BBEF|nr:hypothetical protein [Cupriavidus alkaliphilus]RAS05008.1 hypothetical protein C7415_109114 [Cupriavidus alkaliphilus]
MDTTATMWMICGEGGRLYDVFSERGVAASGWSQLATLAKAGISRQALIDHYKILEPNAKVGTAISDAPQVWRFVNEMRVGDWVVAYSSPNRTYMVGRVSGSYEHEPQLANLGMAHDAGSQMGTKAN